MIKRTIEYEWGLRNDGKPLKVWRTDKCKMHRYSFSVLDQCERCGRLSSADWVRKWWIGNSRIPEYRFVPAWGRKRHVYPHEPTLCMGCMNVLRPLWKRKIAAAECRTEINRMQLSIRQHRKKDNAKNVNQECR